MKRSSTELVHQTRSLVPPNSNPRTSPHTAMDDEFDNVSWRDEPINEQAKPAAGPSEQNISSPPNSTPHRKRRTSSPAQAGHLADAVDLAGIADGHLDCIVDKPLKENDGSKDAYISYLVTTHVRRGLHLNSSVPGFGR